MIKTINMSSNVWTCELITTTRRSQATPMNEIPNYGGPIMVVNHNIETPEVSVLGSKYMCVHVVRVQSVSDPRGWIESGQTSELKSKHNYIVLCYRNRKKYKISSKNSPYGFLRKSIGSPNYRLHILYMVAVKLF